MWFRIFLSRILATFTQHPREIVHIGKDFTWSKKSFVHNFFRIYELIFGRRFGVRIETMLISTSNGENKFTFFTKEARLAHFEANIRDFVRNIKDKILSPARIYFPRLILSTPVGIVFPWSQVLMAIAYDTSLADSNAGTSVTTHTTAGMTITGSNITVALCGFGQAASASYPTTAKWGGSGGTAMTTCSADIWITGAAISTSAWYLDNLSSDTQSGYVSYSVTQSRIGVGMISMTGAKNGSLGTVGTNSSSSVTPLEKPITTAADNSLVVAFCTYNRTDGSTASGTNQTQRFNTSILANHDMSGSTQTTTTAGSYTSGFNFVAATGGTISVVEFKAGAAATVANPYVRLLLMGVG